MKNDPWSASKYFTEADRLEDIQADQAREMLVMQGGEKSVLTSDNLAANFVDENNDAVIVINELGIIQVSIH